jgi:organic hydroperoxide reductase OsmC/OhrA
MSNTHNYEVNLQWNHDTLGTVSSPLIANTIEVATPPEFAKGMAGVWTPEHLFVASVNACLMATFLAIADNSKLEFVSFKSNAIGKVEKIDNKFIVTEIVIEPRLVIPSGGNEERMKRVFEMSEKACAVSNSIKSKISLLPIITKH